VRIEKAGKTSSPAAPAPIKAPGPAAPSSGAGSFSNAADDAALALQIEEAVINGHAGPKKDGKKAALESIDDIAARASLNIVERKKN
jgi:hypothetical protein